MKRWLYSLLAMMPAVVMSQNVSTPDQLYGDLFHQVQMQRIFPDGKTFVDCTPKRPVKDIMYDYGLQKGPNMNLKKFVEENFELPKPPQLTYITQEKDVVMHIKNLWNVLKRDADKPVPGSSLLPLPNPYIVPGGRFGEIYYWDSYFTMLGLKESGEVETIQHMVDNFAYLINTYGHIPNGNRSYYLSRSQPPFFALMVELLAGIKGKDTYKQYIEPLQKEYTYWMRGAGDLKPGEAKLCVVKLPNGDVLNRYWDESDAPRQESYREDVLTADEYASEKMATMRFASKEAEEAMRQQLRIEAWHHLRAGAASGIDFSSRWFTNPQQLHTIRTTDFIPPDLNALLYQLETVLGRAFQLSGNQAKSTAFYKKASSRAALIDKYCWNKKLGYYCDYDVPNAQVMDVVTPAGMYPFCVLPTAGLKTKIASAANTLRSNLLKPGGIVTTTVHNGQQWDAPNGWAPLQWMSIWGLDRNGEKALAKDIAQRWVKLNVDVFNRTGKMLEKYNVEDTHLESGGGEYPTQDGFGWSNGVLLALMKKYSINQ